jgi:hypothetical protein
MFDRLKRFFRPAPAAPAKPARFAAGASPLAPRPNAEEIARALPLIFQRTGKNFSVHADARAASMDEAPGETGARPLPDVWRVQDTVPGVLFSWFGAHSFIGHQACAILAQHWLIAKACGQAPKDAAQNGFRPVLTMEGGEVPQDVAVKIDARNQEMGILEECREFSRLSRVFGVRHALFLVDDIDYAAPFNPDGVRPGSYRGISQIDPYWISPVFDAAGISDPAGRHFYEPTWWKLPDGRLAHRSHFVIITEDEVPDVLKPTYYYGGIPLPQQIYERVYAAERTANEAPELALTKRLITMKGQIENYITDENEVTERLHAFNRIRSNHGFLMVGEDEDIQQIDTALADFDALIMTQYQLVAAIARTPATKLLGTSPKGFNATGEHESDSYDQELVSIQAGGMTPLLDRHHLLLCRSEFSEYPGLSVGVEWNPVRALKPAEKADLNLKDAQAAQARVTAQIIAPDEERRRLVNDPDGDYAFLAGEEPADDLDLDGLDLPETDGEGGEMENLDESAANMDAALPRGFSRDDKWITVKPNGPDAKGAPVLVGEGGEIKAGMGGKFKGKKLSEVPRTFENPTWQAKQKTSQPAEPAQKTETPAPAGVSARLDPSKPYHEDPDYVAARDAINATLEKLYEKRWEPVAQKQIEELRAERLRIKALNKSGEKVAPGDLFEGKGIEGVLQSAKEKTVARRTIRGTERARENLYLDVPYAARETARKAGASWDPDKKKWYVPAGVLIKPDVQKYIPGSEAHTAQREERAAEEQRAREARQAARGEEQAAREQRAREARQAARNDANGAPPKQYKPPRLEDMTSAEAEEMGWGSEHATRLDEAAWERGARKGGGNPRAFFRKRY